MTGLPYPSLGRAVLVSSLLLGAASAARADQFVVTDVTYTHAAANTSDSHYRVVPLASAPKNWKSPVDYTSGSIHILLEVKTKPKGDAETRFQICFEATPTYACTLQSPLYTKPGRYEWSSKFTELWSPAGKKVDWSLGVNKVALIVKDNANGKPQGDPRYVPTELHVEAAIVSAGSTYVPPTADRPDAGSADAGGFDDAAVPGSAADASSPVEPGNDAATPSSPPLPQDGGATPSPRDAASDGLAADAGARPESASDDITESDEAGCALGAGQPGQGLLALFLLALARRRRAAT